ncbi:MAG: magnesium transporter [Clostridiales bacterium]|nr:magnesium transporter [Clostridiales bacterium]
MYEELLEMIENKKYKSVKESLLEMHVQDIADLLEQIESPSDIIKVFRLLPKDIGAEVFSYIESDIQEKLVTALSDKEISYIIEEMYIDDAVDFMEEMPGNVVERVLRASNKETRLMINKYLGYQEDTAGSIMTPEFIDLKENTTVSTCLKRIKRLGENVETINVMYITDQARVLKGVVTIRDILLAEEDAKIGDIMDDNVIYAETSTDQEEIARIFKQYDFIALPIVDKEKRLVGIVTVDDIVNVIEEEATEDIALMAGATPSEKPYLKTSSFRLWINRIPWLIFLLLSATFTGLIISKNESVLSTGIYGILLTACMPMIMGTGGNAGGQASATIIRGIALNEIEFKDSLKVMWKELKVSLLIGVSLSVLCFGKIMLLDGLLFKTEGVTAVSSLVISISMLVTIVISKLVGCMLPLLAKKCHLDPAVVANPFITTIIDILSLLIYCNLAIAFLF